MTYFSLNCTLVTQFTDLIWFCTACLKTRQSCLITFASGSIQPYALASYKQKIKKLHIKVQFNTKCVLEYRLSNLFQSIMLGSFVFRPYDATLLPTIDLIRSRLSGIRTQMSRLSAG